MSHFDQIAVQGHEFLLFAVSLCTCVLLVVLGRHVPRLSGNAQNLSAVQAMHVRSTPRVGGLAIFLAFAGSLLFVPAPILDPYRQFFLATSILFAIGILEDLGFCVSPWKRLMVTMIASLAVISLLGVWLPRADIPGLDGLMSHWAVGIPLTLLVTAGIANGFNLIDGVNGLASMTALVAAIALALIADRAGYPAMVQIASMLAAGILGFFVVNYPFGLIFLGDAGAYMLGFVLSWFGISILLNAPEASPWAILLTLFWPVADTILAIWRRSRRKAATMAPDRLHVHQMVMRALEIWVLGRGRRDLANPLSTLVLAPFVAAPPVFGVLFWNQSLMALLSVLGFALLFFGGYALAFRCLRDVRRRKRQAACKEGSLRRRYADDEADDAPALGSNL